MERTRNIYAIILATLVIAVTVLALLGIWGILEFDYQLVLKRSLWSIFTLFVSSMIIMFIFNVLYRPIVKPPTPPSFSKKKMDEEKVLS